MSTLARIRKNPELQALLLQKARQRLSGYFSASTSTVAGIDQPIIGEQPYPKDVDPVFLRPIVLDVDLRVRISRLFGGRSKDHGPLTPM